MGIGKIRALFFLALAANVQAGEARSVAIYDEQANAGSAVTAALARAGAEDKRVLIDFGANWCMWCRGLDRVFREEPAAKQILERGFVLVNVDVGKFDRNLPLARHYGVTRLEDTGIPILVVLDQAGKVVKVKDAGDFERRQHDGYDTAKIRRFLQEMAPARAPQSPRPASSSHRPPASPGAPLGAGRQGS